MNRSSDAPSGPLVAVKAPSSDEQDRSDRGSSGGSSEPCRWSPATSGFRAVLMEELMRYVSERSALAILSAAATSARVHRDQLAPMHIPIVAQHVRSHFNLVAVSVERTNDCLSRLRACSVAEASPVADEMIVVRIEGEQDIVIARQEGRHMALRLGFSEGGSVKVSIAISELSRNILKYANAGTVTLTTIRGSRHGIQIVARDRGPGIPHLAAVLKPGFVSRTGMGAGLRGARALMDSFDVVTGPGRGTIVTIRKLLC